MEIENLHFDSNIFLAPMAGVTDVSFRKLCKFFGAGLTSTEMISVKGLFYDQKKTKEMLRTFEGESPKCVQLFGHEPKIFEAVIKSGVIDNFDILDINMGCPAPKIVKNGEGSALLKNFELASEIISTCVKSWGKPVSVKFRKGYGVHDDVAKEFAKMCESAGASFITYHPRTKEQAYSGQVDFDDLKAVVQAVNIPVFASGDIVDKETFDKAMKTGVKGVMIGRKAVGCPEIFSQLLGKDVKMDKEQIARLHLKILREYYDEKDITNIFKRHALSYTLGENGGVEKRKKIAVAKNIKEIEEVLFS